MTVNSSGREERLARALRENLKRRKARDRAAAKPESAPSTKEPEPRPNNAGTARDASAFFEQFPNLVSETTGQGLMVAIEPAKKWLVE